MDEVIAGCMIDLKKASHMIVNPRLSPYKNVYNKQLHLLHHNKSVASC